MKRSMKVAAAAATVVALAGGPTTAALAAEGPTTAPPAAGHEQSGDVGVQSVQGDYVLGAENGVRIRTRPVGDATVVGKGYYRQGATIHCFRHSDGYVWYYHTNNTTGKKGWSNNGYMVADDPLYKQC